MAYLHEQGQDLIIFPVASSFGNQPQSVQSQELIALERRAHAAGLQGFAVVVWDAGGGRMGFMGPRPFHHFLGSINLQLVMSNLNREISW
ncbi:hypothetical protein J6497_39260 [Bradyrhizobium sp. CNPSo 4026]|nr:hypothetical protein [Bradyrhizobium cenepequi]